MYSLSVNTLYYYQCLANRQRQSTIGANAHGRENDLLTTEG